MLAQQAKVTYRDGTTARATLTQWSMGQWAQHCQRQGWNSDPSAMGLLAVTMLRYQAWCELHRDVKTRPGFDTWDATVDAVDPEGDGAVDPTPPATSGG